MTIDQIERWIGYCIVPFIIGLLVSMYIKDWIFGVATVLFVTLVVWYPIANYLIRLSEYNRQTGD